MSRVDAGSSTAYLVDAGVVVEFCCKGTDLTLIDGGYPGQADKVVESIERIGRRPRGYSRRAAHPRPRRPPRRAGETAAALRIRRVHGSGRGGPRRRDYLQQANAATLASIPRNLPLVLRWMSKVLPLGVLSRKGLQGLAFGETGPLDLPGRPNPLPRTGIPTATAPTWWPRSGAGLRRRPRQRRRLPYHRTAVPARRIPARRRRQPARRRALHHPRRRHPAPRPRPVLSGQRRRSSGAGAHPQELMVI